MATRKRDAWTRARAKRKRPKTNAPTDGWVLAELAEVTGLSPTTVRYYVRERLIRPLEVRGTITRYDRHQLMLLLGFLRLKSDDPSSLAEKKRKLEAMGDEGLGQWLRCGPLPPAAAVALGFGTAHVTGEASSASGSLRERTSLEDNTGAGSAIALGTVEYWERIRLLPGLELMIRADATPTARAAAQRICDECAVLQCVRLAASRI